MNRRSFVALGCATVLVGCVQTSAPEFANFAGERIEISASATPGMFDALFTLSINSETVIQQRSQAFGGSSQTFEGVWRGRPITARATRVQNFVSSYTQVDVFIAGELVETLTI
jgi:hypothetical protein